MNKKITKSKGFRDAENSSLFSSINKNKRAFIIVFEATIALMILFGFLFMSLDKQRQITSQNYNRQDQNMMLLKYLNDHLEKDESMRQYISTNNEYELNFSTQNYLSTFNKEMNSRVVVCNYDGDCSFGEFPTGVEVSTSEFLVGSASGETKKVKIYLW